MAVFIVKTFIFPRWSQSGSITPAEEGASIEAILVTFVITLVLLATPAVDGHLQRSPPPTTAAPDRSGRRSPTPTGARFRLPTRSPFAVSGAGWTARASCTITPAVGCHCLSGLSESRHDRRLHADGPRATPKTRGRRARRRGSCKIVMSGANLLEAVRTSLVIHPPTTSTVQGLDRQRTLEASPSQLQPCPTTSSGSARMGVPLERRRRRLRRGRPRAAPSASQRPPRHRRHRGRPDELPPNLET